MIFRAANIGDVQTLSAICVAAKGYWNYPPEWLALWEADLAVTPEQIRSHYVDVCEFDGRVAGFIAISFEAGLAEVEHLWVLPEFMGKGVGRALLERGLEWCRANDIVELKVVSDPNALGFYQALGGKIIGEQPSVPAPRVLPVLLFSIHVSK